MTYSDANRFQCPGVMEHLREFHLPKVPYLQIFLARCVLGLDYRLPGKRTTITIDGLEHLEGDQPMMVAMNHTDRFNYMPFMKELDRLGYCPLAPWVKGKYYQNPRLARLLSWCACMPVPSRGFLLSLDWLARRGSPPNAQEYRQLRMLGDGDWSGAEDLEPTVADYLAAAPGGGVEGFTEAFHAHFEGLSSEVVRINFEAMGKGYRPLVFPQGTRSRPLTRGFSGIVQMALHIGVPIVPVGVSGSDLLYPGDIPFSKGGHVHYRVGRPFDPGAEHGAPRDFVPLTIRASQQHGEAFDRLTQGLMDRINDLLAPEYQYDRSRETQPSGAERFL